MQKLETSQQLKATKIKAVTTKIKCWNHYRRKKACYRNSI